MTKIEQIQKAHADYTQLVASLGKEAVAEQLKALFDAHPELEAVRWEQYTPGFNDGDPCEFSMTDVTYKLSGDGELDQDEDEEEYDGFVETPWDAKKRTPLHDAIDDFADARIEDIMLQTFGNGFRITATRDGVEVEDYDCGY